MQDKKLRRLVEHSFETVPYYNKLFRASDIRPEDIRTVDDLDKIPISKKTDLSDLPIEKITASDFNLKKCFLAQTSGTSGLNFQFYREKKVLAQNLLRHYYWHLQVGDNIRNKRLIIGVAWLPSHFFERMGFFPAKRISPFANMLDQLKSINEFNPTVLMGWPSALRVIAREVLDKGLQIKMPLIFSGGEMLDIHTRKLLEKTFVSEVFNAYGLTEIGSVCGECRLHTGQHVFGDRVIVEISKDGEKTALGEKGCITITNLDRYSTPFLRYNTEDIGMLIKDECVCGSQFPLMRITDGRKSDTILLNDGRLIPAQGVCGSLYTIPGIRQFQIIQKSTNSFVVRIIQKYGSHENLDNRIIRLLEKHLGEVQVEVQVVDAIPRLRSGKWKQFISQIPH